ncbi:hypothetical protein GobsT_19020 [Gemmata obscuriglobus]|uniref:DUF5678 domain-containing protein n=1 Tax=Gemmata obscuriglobus TaxID=114 RepID=A0A2Z3H888_9BACT|nr:hypothetical protein [Gemmata obscuriglobus]AWM39737.1 hypothetical protein C1280_23875 [Gemmata obscuriglobus]QEG27148.1 hypothetical protein GobsT_19020 [Gemmata obscuriglobus]VTS03741.1 unnamed protein product [Gemmata obscuriglobus UQM 2246]
MAEHNLTVAGADWAQYDPDVAGRYGGNWVVAVARQHNGRFQGEVIAHGQDPEAVRRTGAERLGVALDVVVVCAVATMESRTWIGW